jgi:hypothetical protein
MDTSRKVLSKVTEKIHETEKSRYFFTSRITQFLSIKRSFRIQEFLKGNSLKDKNM